MIAKLIFLFYLISFSFIAQEFSIQNNYSGVFSVGSRSTFSFFDDIESSSFGMGIGGQFRLQVTNQLNTEWFFDYLSSNLNDQIHRTDFHIGWSVMYYPIDNNENIINPYIAAGHCFDQTYLTNSIDNLSFNRFSSAVQGGLGINFNIHPRWDITLLSQYMIHLGKEIVPNFQSGTVTFEFSDSHRLEGHLLSTLSINYKLKDLW